jgi:Bifunctional DNA primase/polymerase, N-terminal
MSTFIEIALLLADRGFQVFPLIPRSKQPIAIAGAYDHFDAATTDPAQIASWNKQNPTYNVGIIPDEIFCYLETDDEAALKAACSDLPADIWETTRVSARENRCYYVFRQTSRTKRAGNMTATREGQDNLFELKVHRLYVAGPGSIHPTGKPYGVEWRTIPVMPDILLNRLCELHGAPKAAGPKQMPDDIREKTGSLDKFLEYYEVATLGAWFNKGKLWYRPIECPWLGEHENPNQGTSTCVVVIEGGGYKFDCKHRCNHKTWPEFRAELQSRFPNKPKFFFNEPGLEPPRITVGKGTAEVTGSQPPPELLKPKRPEYAIEVWDNVPRKMYAEAFRSCLGAVVGDRLILHGVEGGNPRTFTIEVAPKGKGKGTAIRRSVNFFRPLWRSTWVSSTPGLLSGERDFVWKPKGIGAWLASASSVPGMARLTKDLKKTISQKPHLAWQNTLPRILSVHEEMKTFLSTLFIEGGVGSGMEGVICQLWDDVSFNGTATGTRDAIYGEMMFSLLCGVTEQDWFDLLSKGNSVGSGLMSRFNIVGTEGNYQNEGKLKPPNFTLLQETLCQRIMQLEDAHANILPSEAAERVVSEWFKTLPEGCERLNIHVWRTALVLAWLKHEEVVSEKTALDAIKLGDYQVASHDYYRVASADNATAKVQAKIVRALQVKGPCGKRELQRRTHAERDGTELWNRGLDGLLKDGRVGRLENSVYFGVGGLEDLG